MTTLKKQYAELLALTQLYLFQEYALQKRICVETGVYEDFKQYALSQKAPVVVAPVVSQPAAPLPRASAPLPPPPILPPAPLESPVVTQSHHLEVVKKTANVPEIQKESKQEKIPSAFELEPLGSPPGVDISDFHAIFIEKFSKQPILDHIPDDLEARRINRAWEQAAAAPEVILLSFHEMAKHRQFLNHLCVAIDSLGIKAAIFSAADKENAWDSRLKSKGLRLVIACGNHLFAMPELMKYFKEAPKKGRQYLGSVPLLLLSDLSVYFKEPSLKISLWRALRETLSPLSSR